MAAPQSTPLPEAPTRGEAEGQFVPKANAFVGALEPFRQQLQAQADFVNERSTETEENAALAQEASEMALSSANFAGDWSVLTGAFNVPTSVLHDDTYWQLLEDVSNIQDAEPGVSAAWAPINVARNVVLALPNITALSSLNTAALVDGQQFSVKDGGKVRHFSWDEGAESFVELLANGGVFESVAEMKSSERLQVGQIVNTSGYYTAGDGGGNDYEIVEAGTGTDDGGSFIDLDNGVQARGLFPNGVLSVTQFGAVLDGVTDDINSVQPAIDFMKESDFTELVFIRNCFLSVKPISEQGNYFVFFGESKIIPRANYPKGSVRQGYSQEGTETSYHNLRVVEDTNDQIGVSGSKVNGLKVRHDFGGAGTKGGRHAIYGLLIQDEPTDLDNPDQFYVGVQGQVLVRSDDGGTGTGLSTSKGAYFGSSSIVTVEEAGKNLLNVTGAEVNTQMRAGSSCAYKSGVQIVSKDEETADRFDAAIAISAAGSDTVGYEDGILLGSMNGQQPIGENGSIIKTEGANSISALINSETWDVENIILAQGFRLRNDLLEMRRAGAETRMGSLTESGSVSVQFRTSGEGHASDSSITALGGSPASPDQGTIIASSSSFVFSSNPRPSNDGGRPLGAPGFRWSEVFAANAAINTSDEREKQDVVGIPDEVLDAWAEVEWVQYRMIDSVQNKDENARVHFGLLAQQVKSVFDAHGLDPFKYSLLCYDRWDEVPEVTRQVEAEYDGDGNLLREGRIEVVQQYRPAGDLYGIRYDHAQAIEAAYQRRRIAKLEALLANANNDEATNA